MNCNECEELILETLETSLAENQRPALRAHVAICPSCRQFQQAQLRLDAALAKSIRRPNLSPDFSARILHQVDQELARTTSASVEARKQAAEADFQARMAELKQGPFGSRVLRMLDVIGLGAAGLLSGLLLSSLLPRLASLPLPSVPTAWQGSMTYAPWVTAALIVAAGMALGRRRDLLARLRV